MNAKHEETESLPEASSQQRVLNGIDLSQVRLSANFEEAAGVERLLLTIPVRKPTRTEFFRVHPSPEYRISVGVIELKEEGETYLVAGDIAAQLPSEVVPKSIYTCVNRQGVVFLWPVRLPGPDGRLDAWNTSASHIAELATRHWLRMLANRGLGAYDVHQATAIPTEPNWPSKSFAELMSIAFRDRFITSEDHPVLRQLRGEV
ncbi:MAG: hypothetical protein K1X67_05670 [Fimbriimonadaceae bacterium]|nr:hypothetical protein [Fimbriimonadaceae bacterium]